MHITECARWRCCANEVQTCECNPVLLLARVYKSRRIDSQKRGRNFLYFFLSLARNVDVVDTNIRFNKLIINLGMKHGSLWLNWSRHLSPFLQLFFSFSFARFVSVSPSSHVRFSRQLIECCDVANLKLCLKFSSPAWCLSDTIKKKHSIRSRAAATAAIQFILFTFIARVLRIYVDYNTSTPHTHQSFHSSSAANLSRSVSCIELLTNSEQKRMRMPSTRARMQ